MGGLPVRGEIVDISHLGFREISGTGLCGQSDGSDIHQSHDRTKPNMPKGAGIRQHLACTLAEKSRQFSAIILGGPETL